MNARTIKPTIDFDGITALLQQAADEGRHYLFEYEVYELLRLSGAETPPKCELLPRGVRPSDEALSIMPGDKVVLKIVSPTIIHKTEVGGVKIVPNDPAKIRSAWRRMMYEVPENYAAWIERNPGYTPREYAGLAGEALLAAIADDVRGVLMVQFMPPDSAAFGNELIMGVRRTREFGMVMNSGLGGTDTEVYAERFRKGQAVVAASTALTDAETFFELYKKTISYKKLAGLSRGQQRIVTDEQLIECFGAFRALGNHYSPANPDAPFVLEELEINPFAFTDYRMVPLDGMCRFSLPGEEAPARPIARIRNLLRPERIGVIGVSGSRMNFGRMILRNILTQGFPRDNVVVLNPKETEIDGVACVSGLDAVQGELDLLVVAIGAQMVPDLVEEVIDKGTVASVLLIPGGLGETEDSKERAERIVARIGEAHRSEDGGPVFLGGNSMGVISHPGGYDTWFVPDAKLPKHPELRVNRAAFISQSGAFMAITMSRCPLLNPAYLISMGNQTDLTLGDMVAYMKDQDDVDIIAVYAEGFNDLDGLRFVRAVRDAVLAGKDVIFYKAGRTPEGKTATSGHTASLAGDYMVCESCLRQAGAMVAQNFQQFEDLFLLATMLHHKSVTGNRIAAVSGAGFEAVGMADSLQSDDYRIAMASYAPETAAAIAAVLRAKKLDALVAVKNPLDINPSADDEAHATIIEALAKDPGVDAVVASLGPISPVTHTLADTDQECFDMESPASITELAAALFERNATPVVGVVDGGELFEPMRAKLRAAGVPVFESCDNAVATTALYIESRLYRDRMRRHFQEIQE